METYQLLHKCSSYLFFPVITAREKKKMNAVIQKLDAFNT